MFHNRSMENSINRIHERAFKLVYDDSRHLSFKELLAKNNSISIHQKNLQPRYRNFKSKTRDFTGRNFRFISFRKETIQRQK